VRGSSSNSRSSSSCMMWEFMAGQSARAAASADGGEGVHGARAGEVMVL
jgi:hypothetical protein